MKTICIDAWNQAGIDEATFTVRTAGGGGERNDATLKVAIIGGHGTRYCAGFKGGQSKDVGLGIELNVSQTLNAHMSALEPTMVRTFAQNTREEVRVVGDGQIAGSLSAQTGTHQQNYILNSSTQSQGNQMSKAEVRRLTTTEVQRLQGFDEGHLDVNDQGDSAKYSEAGNSWAVPNARAVINGIHKADAKLHGGKRRAFKYGTISSGVEAHTQASAGFGDQAVFFSEISPAPCGVLKAHYPEVPNLGDMTLVDFDTAVNVIHNRPYEGYEPVGKDVLGFDPFKTPEPVEIPAVFGDVNLVSGGTPCQDLSVAGKRKGAVEGSNTRSSLAFQLPRIGAAVGADYILWENVAGAFSSNGGRDFAWLIHRMTQYGYKAIAWRCMDAQFIRTDKHPRGVPQRRRRVWIVGYRGDDWRVPCEALFEPIKVLGSEPPKRTVGVGFLKKIEQDLNCKPMSELEEFQDFLKGANEKILDVLVKKGICESVEERIKELKGEEKKKNAAKNTGFDLLGFDLFGDGASEEKHQGRGLKESDLDLRMPSNSSIREIPEYQVYEWAKSVCTDVLSFGELFKKHDGEAKVDDLNQKMLDNIGNAGFLCDGLVCTMKMPEWNAGVTEEELAEMPTELAALYDGDVCGLSDILDPDPDQKYKLSWRACYGILRRAVNRGKKLPIELGYALVERIIEQAAFVKWAAMYGKDTVKKEGQVSDRQIAKIAFDDFIEVDCRWVDVAEKEPQKKSSDEDLSEGEDSDGQDEENLSEDCGEDGE